jgi:formamidopyrimidine-DNA glycosylase
MGGAMPEAPDLEVIKDYLNQYVKGTAIQSARVLRPTVLRPMAGDFAADLSGRSMEQFRREGKFLICQLTGDRWLVINPMLTGALQYCEPKARVYKRTCLVLELDSGKELRYLDDRQMGMVYYVDRDQLDGIYRLEKQGVDVLADLSFEEFKAGLKKFRGEVKGVLTRGNLVSGIGNAYSDEILFAAGISPFRKVGTLKEDELLRLHRQSRTVVEDAIDVLRERMGDNIHVKIRDFLKVHGKGGEPCPACGGNISQLNANQRLTNFCRRCQPGMLIRN